jgi:hypothetical protein
MPENYVYENWANPVSGSSVIEIPTAEPTKKVKDSIKPLYDVLLSRGIKIFPCDWKKKTPLVKKWAKVATTEEVIIQGWIKEYHDCQGWGIPTGEINGFFVVDVDAKMNDDTWETGLENWDKLINEHNYTPNTVTVETKNKGFHFYYRMPDLDIRNSTGEIATGIDVRGNGGYVMAPVITPYYEYIRDWEGAPLEDCPEWLLELVYKKKNKRNIFSPQLPANASQENKENFALDCITKLSPERADNYTLWLNVGMSLFGLGDIGLDLWDDWSKKSDKYRPGECSQKWETFREINGGLTLASLGYWAKEDSPNSITACPEKATPEDYRYVLTQELGYTFKLNESNDDVLVNGIPMNDFSRAYILYRLENADYLSEKKAELAWMVEASQNSFHPIIDYLNSCTWNGEDHIGKLCSYFEDEQKVFSIWLRRWLIGCVAKVMAYPRGQQNRVLILQGDQNLGKSYFCRWLAGAVPGFYIESPINPEDKDYSIRKINKWIWEIGELGNTTRRADREALKDFLSNQNVTVRKPFAHYDINKPAMANFIGTINDEGIGFLNDPTGSRRFMSCTLTKIDWSYSRDIDINQLWGNAMALFKQGEPWDLTEDEKGLANRINGNYEIENPIAPYIFKYFEVDPKETTWITPTNEIIDRLVAMDVKGYAGNLLSQHIAHALKQMRLTKSKMRITGYSNPVWVWIGIKSNGKKEF